MCRFFLTCAPIIFPVEWGGRLPNFLGKGTSPLDPLYKPKLCSLHILEKSLQLNFFLNFSRYFLVFFLIFFLTFSYDIRREVFFSPRRLTRSLFLLYSKREVLFISFSILFQVSVLLSLY